MSPEKPTHILPPDSTVPVPAHSYGFSSPPDPSIGWTPDDLSKPKPIDDATLERLDRAIFERQEKERIKRDFGTLPGFSQSTDR